MSRNSTRVRQRIAAPPATVYRALTDPAAAGIWLVPDGMRGTVHEFESREGGRLRITLTYDAPTGAGKSTAQSDTYHGRFVELVPGERVVQRLEFETDDPSMQGEMTVTLTLAEVAGGTELLAVHDQLPPGLAPADNELGWRHSLEKLAALVAAR